MKYQIIGTGSTGNAVVIENILIDCGVSAKAIKQAIDIREIALVCLTHIHGDHFKRSSVSWLANERPRLRFACGEWMLPALLEAGVERSRIDVIKVGKTYDYRAFKIAPVKLYHDVPNIGYRIYKDGERALYCTDTGHLDGISAQGYNLYMIEANYDESELQARIANKLAKGEFAYELNVPPRHLSVEQASAFLLNNMDEKSEYVFIHQHVDK